MNREQVRGATSSWAKVRSGVPQDYVLGPLLFQIYINALPNKVDVNLNADDAKIMKEVHNNRDCKILQRPREDAIVVRQMAYKINP